MTAMPTPLICHFLIGPPGSGKSTLVAQMAKQGDYQVVSTDQIREALYGDADTQGDWSAIEAKVVSQIRSAIAAGRPVIYDATNAKRAWRMALLMQLSLPPLTRDGVPKCDGTPWMAQQPTNPPISPSPPPPIPHEVIHWMAWQLTTPLETCKAWNQKRSRQVADSVIERMFRSLQDFPPVPAEGFAAVNLVDVAGVDVEEIQEKTKRLSRTLTNRTNRTRHGKVTLHRYSRLLDFDRLLHLLALVIRHPGIVPATAAMPDVGSMPLATPLEACALMRQLQGAIYADSEAIAADLQWLEQNRLIRSLHHPQFHLGPREVEIEVETLEDPNLVTHAYSDIEPFKRLLKTIRFILHHPFLPNSGGGSLQTLVDALKEQGTIGGEVDTVRKDIEKILKPYQILPDFPLRQGYFAGTGILSRHELRQVFGVLQSQAKSLDDPVALAIYEMFSERIRLSRIDTPDVYPVRAIGNRCIVEADSLSPSALSKNLERLEEAIASGELLELNRISGSGRFVGDEEGFFLAWPLQIVFHNVAWYLGFECEGEGNLFRFERLDRLFAGRPQGQSRDRQAQERSLNKLQKLHEVSAGLHLGYSASDQHQFLSPNKSERSAVEVTVELWFNDPIFRFVSEGTKRFSPRQMRMSPPLGGLYSTDSKSLFSLPKSGDPDFPNRFRVKLPKWSLKDVDLLRWIVGFGGNVKVVQPAELVARVKAIGEEICQVYQS